MYTDRFFKCISDGIEPYLTGFTKGDFYAELTPNIKGLKSDELYLESDYDVGAYSDLDNFQEVMPPPINNVLKELNINQ